MESSSSSQKKPRDKARRVWSKREEEALVNALKDICRDGWKCDNGTFRAGYAVALEAKLQVTMPGTDLRGNPHIESKMKTWKRHHQIISTMMTKSGFGFNEADCSIIVDSDAVWDDFLKVEPKAQGMRHMSFPLYKDWLEIFGKDRATGADAEGPSDAAEAMEKEFPEKIIELEDESDDDEDTIKKEKSTEKRTLKKCKQERKSKGNSDIFVALDSFSERAEARIDKIAGRIGYHQDCAKARTEVYWILDKIETLSINEKLTVAGFLADNPQKMDIFFNCSEEARVEMATMILEGQM